VNFPELLAQRARGDDDSESTEEAKRLNRILPDVVHIVHHGANKRRRVLRKDDSMDTDQMVDGNPVEGDPAAGVALAKALKMPKALKDALIKQITTAGENLASLLTMLKGAEEGGEGLPKEAADAIASVATMLGGLKEKYPSPGVRKSADDPAAATTPTIVPAAVPAAPAPAIGVPPSPIGEGSAPPPNPLAGLEQGLAFLQKGASALGDARLSTYRNIAGFMRDLHASMTPEERAVVGEETTQLSKSLSMPAPAAAISAGNSNPPMAPAKPPKRSGWLANEDITADEDN
jgi:hypothetical protein